MRLVSLCLVEDPNSALSFHPRLTVVFGLTPDARSFLAEALSLMVNGQSAGVYAQVDMDGTLIDVGPGYRRVPAPLEVVNSIVRAQDLLEPRMGATGRNAAASPLPAFSYTTVNPVVHHGGVCEGGVLCTGNRDLYDDFGIEASPTTGFASIIYSDDQYQNDANHKANATYNCTASDNDTSTCDHTNIATQTAGTRIFTVKGK